MAIPKLALIPSTVGGNVYSVLPSNGDGDFDFTRASAATRINAQGLIETVAVGDNRLNYPLIDGVVSGCPSLLLEPSRSNLITYSEDFSNAAWTKSDSSITSNAAISPDGTLNADKVTGSGYLQNVNSLTATNTYTFSFFWKKDTSNVVKILLSSTGTDEQLSINTNTLALISQLGINSYNNISYGNDWYRLSMTWTEANTEPTGIRISADESDATSSLFIWGAQLELGSYATSYIPTQGGVGTRVAEVCSGAGNDQVINSTEGVLYAEISAFDNISRISLSDGSSSNRVSFRIDASSIDFQYRTGGSYSYRVDVNIDTSNTNKIAMSFNNGVFVGYLNGVAIGSPISGASLGQGVLDRLNFNDGDSSDSFNGNVKDVRIYNTALTDQELINLTTI
jgi:hypothetical protein